MTQPIVDKMNSEFGAYRALRRDIHAHPELGFDEHRTVSVICKELDKLSIEYHMGIGKTGIVGIIRGAQTRSEEHTSELQSLMRISYAVFCLTKHTYPIT